MSKAYTAWHAILLKVLNKPNLHLYTNNEGFIYSGKKEGLFVQVEVQDKLSAASRSWENALHFLAWFRRRLVFFVFFCLFT